MFKKKYIFEAGANKVLFGRTQLCVKRWFKQIKENFLFLLSSVKSSQLYFNGMPRIYNFQTKASDAEDVENPIGWNFMPFIAFEKIPSSLSEDFCRLAQ